ncbi:uncharacterized protein LOC62_04G005656 [Vanrija pseudolonga]|uniref:C2H2-type domain-containing protein n=1 Tax=Vanrija pseudolonga TaxID=143232 RepID=A0AAF1BMK6_9TREE|nr:hypothetical protein LOC62_04G005656 [Vanrija pseudolonga]
MYPFPPYLSSAQHPHHHQPPPPPQQQQQDESRAATPAVPNDAGAGSALSPPVYGHAGPPPQTTATGNGTANSSPAVDHSSLSSAPNSVVNGANNSSTPTPPTATPTRPSLPPPGNHILSPHSSPVIKVEHDPSPVNGALSLSPSPVVSVHHQQLHTQPQANVYPLQPGSFNWPATQPAAAQPGLGVEDVDAWEHPVQHHYHQPAPHLPQHHAHHAGQHAPLNPQPHHNNGMVFMPFGPNGFPPQPALGFAYVRSQRGPVAPTGSVTQERWREQQQQQPPREAGQTNGDGGGHEYLAHGNHADASPMLYHPDARRDLPLGSSLPPQAHLHHPHHALFNEHQHDRYSDTRPPGPIPLPLVHRDVAPSVHGYVPARLRPPPPRMGSPGPGVPGFVGPHWPPLSSSPASFGAAGSSSSLEHELTPGPISNGMGLNGFPEDGRWGTAPPSNGSMPLPQSDTETMRSGRGASRRAGSAPTVRRFPCPDCSEAFTRRNDLVRHRRKHSRSSPYSSAN